MPAVYTHYRFGKAVETQLPNYLQEILQERREAFALGTQGPDILFYHKFMQENAVRQRGWDLHAVAAEDFFVNAAKEIALAKTNNEPLLSALTAYVCGFLCHFTLDISCHPYIDNHSQGTFTHGKIESELDKYFLRKDGLPIRGYNTTTPISGENGTIEACATILDVSTDAIALAIQSIKKINGWFSSKCEPFHALAHVVLTIAGLERKFGDMFLHKKDDPRFQGLGDELETLWQNAVPKAAEIITSFFENMDATLENGSIQDDVFRHNYSGLIENPST